MMMMITTKLSAENVAKTLHLLVRVSAEQHSDVCSVDLRPKLSLTMVS